MNGGIVGSHDRLLVSLNSFHVCLDVCVRSSVKFLSAVSRDDALIVRPCFQPITHVDSFSPKSVVGSHQPKPAFGLSFDVVAVYCRAKGASVVIISHHGHIGVHPSLIKHRAVSSRPIKAAHAFSIHEDVKVKGTEVVIACGPVSHRTALHSSCDISLVASYRLHSATDSLIRYRRVKVSKSTLANLPIGKYVLGI